MCKKRVIYLILIVFLAFSSASCAAKVTKVTLTPADEKPEITSLNLPSSPLTPIPTASQEKFKAKKGYPLGINDIIKISVWGHPDLSKTPNIRQDGKIFLPLVGEVMVKGLTIPELREKLIELLSDYIKKPQVDIEVKMYGSKQFYFLGEISRPGVYSIIQPTTILEGLAIVGGFTPAANLAGTYFLRNGKVIPVNLRAVLRDGDLSQNIYLQDRDIIYIPNARDQMIYIIGEIEEPGAIQIMEGKLNLIEAISAAGGFKIGAVEDNIKIIRGGLANPTIISANVKEILDKNRLEKLENLQLVAGDIVYVPDTRISAWNKIIKQITPTMNLLFTVPLGIASDYFVIKELSGGGR